MEQKQKQLLTRIIMMALLALVLTFATYRVATNKKENVLIIAPDGPRYVEDHLPFLTEKNGYTCWYVNQSSHDPHQKWHRHGHATTAMDVEDPQMVSEAVDKLKNKGLTEITYIVTPLTTPMMEVRQTLHHQLQVKKGQQSPGSALQSAAPQKTPLTATASRPLYQVEAILDKGKVTHFAATKQELRYGDPYGNHPYLIITPLDVETTKKMKDALQKKAAKWQYTTGAVTLQYSRRGSAPISAIPCSSQFTNEYHATIFNRSQSQPDADKKAYQAQIAILPPRTGATYPPHIVFILEKPEAINAFKEENRALATITTRNDPSGNDPITKDRRLTSDDAIMLNFAAEKEADLQRALQHFTANPATYYPFNTRYAFVQGKDKKLHKVHLNSSFAEHLWASAGHLSGYENIEERPLYDDSSYVDKMAFCAFLTLAIVALWYLYRRHLPTTDNQGESRQNLTEALKRAQQNRKNNPLTTENPLNPTGQNPITGNGNDDDAKEEKKEEEDEGALTDLSDADSSDDEKDQDRDNDNKALSLRDNLITHLYEGGVDEATPRNFRPWLENKQFDDDALIEDVTTPTKSNIQKEFPAIFDKISKFVNKNTSHVKFKNEAERDSNNSPVLIESTITGTAGGGGDYNPTQGGDNFPKHRRDLTWRERMGLKVGDYILAKNKKGGVEEMKIIKLLGGLFGTEVCVQDNDRTEYTVNKYNETQLRIFRPFTQEKSDTSHAKLIIHVDKKKIRKDTGLPEFALEMIQEEESQSGSIFSDSEEKNLNNMNPSKQVELTNFTKPNIENKNNERNNEDNTDTEDIYPDNLITHLRGQGVNKATLQNFRQWLENEEFDDKALIEDVAIPTQSNIRKEYRAIFAKISNFVNNNRDANKIESIDPNTSTQNDDDERDGEDGTDTGDNAYAGDTISSSDISGDKIDNEEALLADTLQEPSMDNTGKSTEPTKTGKSTTTVKSKRKQKQKQQNDQTPSNKEENDEDGTDTGDNAYAGDTISSSDISGDESTDHPKQETEIREKRSDNCLIL